LEQSQTRDANARRNREKIIMEFEQGIRYTYSGFLAFKNIR
jgi:hypothetical protein